MGAQNTFLETNLKSLTKSVIIIIIIIIFQIHSDITKQTIVLFTGDDNN